MNWVMDDSFHMKPNQSLDALKSEKACAKYCGHFVAEY